MGPVEETMRIRELSTKKDIARRLEELRLEKSFVESINTGCGTCDAFNGRGCKRADGAEPPPEVKAEGCPEWRFDGIPF